MTENNYMFMICGVKYNNWRLFFSEATQTDGACEESQQCSTPFPNSDCVSGKCACLTGFVQNTGKDKCLARKYHMVFFPNS